MTREDSHDLDELNELQSDLGSPCEDATYTEREKKINVLEERAAAKEGMIYFRTTPFLHSADEWEEIFEDAKEDDFFILAGYFDWHYRRQFGGRLSFYKWKKGEAPRNFVDLSVWTEEDLWPVPLYDDIRNETNEDEIRKIFCDNIGKGLKYRDPVLEDDKGSLINKIKEISQKAKIYFEGDISKIW